MTDVVEMRVRKRDGRLEEVAFDKILGRVKKLGAEAQVVISFSALVAKIVDQLYDEIPTSKIDELTAEQCASMTTQHLDYGTLAARIVISNNQKDAVPTFSAAMLRLGGVRDVHGKPAPLLAGRYSEFIIKHRDALDAMAVPARDYLIDYFGFKTLERAYLMKVGGKCVETAQYMWLRVSVGIHAHSGRYGPSTFQDQGDLRSHVNEIFYACNAYTLQQCDAAAAAEFLFPAVDEEGQH